MLYSTFGNIKLSKNLPKSRLENEVLEQELLQTSKVRYGVEQKPHCKAQPSPRVCPPTSGGMSPPGTQPVGSQETSSGTTPAQQAVLSQSPEINHHQNNIMSDFEIRILKTKIIADNNLDGMLSLENRIEPGIDETIDTRLERDNLVQEPPGNDIDLSHLSESFQKDYNNLFVKYKEAFSTDRFDIGLFTGFGQGINLDVIEGTAY